MNRLKRKIGKLKGGRKEQYVNGKMKNRGRRESAELMRGFKERVQGSE